MSPVCDDMDPRAEYLRIGAHPNHQARWPFTVSERHHSVLEFPVVALGEQIQQTTAD